VVVVGDATGLAQVVQDKPVAGIHEYDVPPVALSVVDDPIQILAAEPALIVGNGFTDTVSVVELTQPAPGLVPVIV
jgi:hypothetical protein